MRITLTGASGFIGRALVEKLRQEGHELCILGRKAPEQLPPAAHFWKWEAGGGEPPRESLEGSDAVIHLAGEPVAQRWTDEVKKRLRDSRVLGTRQLVQALSTIGKRPKILISGSAIGYYGNRGDETLTETSRPGKDFLAQLCMEWEAQADLAQALGMRVVLVRTGIVLGKGGGALQEMLPPFRAGVGGRLGSGRQWMSWIHLEDEIALLLTALHSPAIRGPVNATAPHPVRNADFTAALGKALGRPTVLAVPKFALKLTYGEMAEIMLGGQRVLPQAAETHGFEFRYRELAGALGDSL